MNWYIAKVIFKICAGSTTVAQFDEHLRLIHAENFEHAFVKARLIGIGEEDQFVNENQRPVNWEFVNVTEILPLQELCDGLEVYSQIHETAEAKSYINLVHRKAAALQLAN
jgi:hypothetical protein